MTRGELRDEIERLEERLEKRLEGLEKRLEERFDRKLELLATKAELAQLEVRFDHKLDLWGGALLARIESGEQRLLGELARHANAIQESMSTQIAAIDEKYADLPGRVTRLESLAESKRAPRARAAGRARRG